MRPASKLRAALGLAGVVFLLTSPARADETDTERLREVARVELERTVAALEAADRRKLAGTYVAFDDDAADPIAIAACDDDGDHVVVLSDAMLRLVRDVARVQAVDDVDGTRRVEEHASFLARAQLPERKLLPLQHGAYRPDASGRVEALAHRHFADAIAFVVGHEVARLRAADVTCPHPTVTREAGDGAWTRDERRRAMETADRVYRAATARTTQTARDEEASRRAIATGHDVAGALGLLRFVEQLERERLLVVGRFTPSYVALHPSAATRAATMRAAEAEAKRRDLVP